MLFGSFSLNDALILAVVLAPTDAGLGSAVVTDTRLPQVVRQSLNVESGLNDGICVPLLLILLGVVGGPASHPLRIVSEEIGYGILSGLGAAVLSSGIVIFTSRRNMIDATWRQIIPLATTLAAYGGALALGGRVSSPPSSLAQLLGFWRSTTWRTRCALPKRLGWPWTASPSSSLAPSCLVRNSRR